MQILNSNRTEMAYLRASRWGARGLGWMGILAAGAGAFAAAAGGFTAALVLLPPVMVFPVTALGLLVTAATFALIAWASPPETGPSRIVFWDFSGALTLIGLAAALFGEPEQAIALLERDR